MKEDNLIPKSLLEFEKMFATEEQCVDYIIRMKYTNGYKCTICGHGKYRKRKKYLLRCSKCGYDESILCGTIFELKKKPLVLYFRAIWNIVVQKNGTNAMTIQSVLGLGSYNSAWAWSHKIRRSMVRLEAPKLSGTVEIDEGFLGGKTTGGKRGRGTTRPIVIVGIEQKEKKQLGRAKIRYISDSGHVNLHNFIKENVESGSTIITDDWNGYNGIEEYGYKRIIQKPVDDEEELPHVHLIISLLKRWLLGTMQGSYSRKYLPYYLDEYVFRFNRRKSKHRGLLFYRLMEIAVNKPPTTLKEIKENEKRANTDQGSSSEQSITNVETNV